MHKLTRFAAVLLVLTMCASTAKAALIAWYPLHGDATAAMGVDGMLVNGPTPVPDQNGTPNGALNFQLLPNDSGSYVSVPGGAGLPSLSQGTVAMWVNWSGPQDVAFQSTNFGSVLARQSNGVYSNNVLGINNADPAVGP